MTEVERLQQRTLRQQMILQAAYVWNSSEERINSCVEQLLQVLHEQEAKNLLQESHRILKGATDALAYNDEYVKEEDPVIFKELVSRLVEVFKNIFESFTMEDHSYTPGDNRIDDLAVQFYDAIAWMRGLGPRDFVSQAYPSITLLVRMVRNCQEHVRNKPVDHITHKTSFGNVYTLSSIMILSIYAYLEILQAWTCTLNLNP